VQALKSIVESVFMAFRYDSKTKINEFSQLGQMQNNFVVFGKEGVGKSMAFDAIVNYAQALSKQTGKKLYVTDMVTAVKTPLVDMGSKILEEFFKRELKGDQIYINIFDENGGGIFYNSNKGNGSNQEDSKRLETAKKMFGIKTPHTINIIATNYTDDNSMEAAFKQRFCKVKLEGPTKPEDFAKVLQIELADLINIGIVEPNVNWNQLGAIFANYKTYERAGFAVTGRSVEKACSSLNGVNKLFNKVYLLDQNKVPSQKFFAEYKKLHDPITHAAISNAIEVYLKNEWGARDYRIDSQQPAAHAK
jgi:hypothetical protein